MGRTDNFFPGISNGSVDDVDACWSGGRVEAASDVEVSVTEADEVVAASLLVVVVVASLLKDEEVCGRVTVDMPLTLMLEAEVDCEVGDGVDVGTGVGVDVGPEGVGVDSGGLATADDAPATVTPSLLLLDAVELEIIVGTPGMVGLVTVEGSVLTVVTVPFAPPAPGLVKASVHSLTSSTAGLPSLSTMGVRVITHVSTIGPAMVWVVCIVCTLVAF